MNREQKPYEWIKTEVSAKELVEMPASIHVVKNTVLFWIKKGGAAAVNIFTRELVWHVRRERELIDLCSENEKVEYAAFCEHFNKVSNFPAKP